MRWFRRRQAPTPLLSDAEMARLHEEIFEEPVSIERLFMIRDAVPDSGDALEWVMDGRMYNRIRRLCAATSWTAYFEPLNFGGQVELIGLPIAVEPFAKLAIRKRVPA